jgi:hypothetical protein
MKNLTSLGLCALITPALTLGVSSAFAQEQGATQELAQEQRETPRGEAGQRAPAERAQEQRAQGAEEREAMPDSMTRRPHQQAYLSGKPAEGFHASDLIGASLLSRSDDDELGSIRDLVVDESGQIVAVIVGVGGVLGIGEKDVAVSWDQVERTMDTEKDGYVYKIDATQDALSDAPEYIQE